MMLPSSEMDKDSAGIFPVLNSEKVDIKWLIQKDEWLATHPDGKKFNMFENGTTLDGSVTLVPDRLKGAGSYRYDKLEDHFKSFQLHIKFNQGGHCRLQS